MKVNSTSEDEFLHLLYEIQKGEKPIDSLLIHPEFERRGRQFCYMYQTHYVSVEYGPEDLYHDACLKVLNHPDALSNVDNIPNKQAFFSWFRAIVFNVFIDEIRKRKRKRIPKDTLPIEGFDIADSDDPTPGCFFESL
jgi:DNA-directed RNA polymerase specialized sigma24 family protein